MSALLVADRDGRYTDANDDALALLGVTREQLLAAKIGDFSGPHADMAAKVWHRLATTGAEIPTGEATLYRPDGIEVRVRYTAFEHLGDGTYRIEFVLTPGDPETPPVADRPSQVLREWRAADRAVDAGERDGALTGSEGLRELYQHSTGRRKEPTPER
jgi:PAS domain S-box-containing protein